eukprot:4862613-Alexandrium_andersonii.AAC.1
MGGRYLPGWVDERLALSASACPAGRVKGCLRGQGARGMLGCRKVCRVCLACVCVAHSPC